MRRSSSMASLLEELKFDKKIELLSPKNLDSPEPLVTQFFSYFPVENLIAPDVLERFTESCRKHIKSLKKTDIDDNYQLINQEKQQLFETWHHKVLIYVKNNLLDDKGLFKARIIFGMGGEGGTAIYQEKIIKAVVLVYVNLLIQTIVKNAFAKEAQKKALPVGLSPALLYLSKLTHPAVTELIKIKSFSNASDHLGSMISEFVSSPGTMRSVRDYKVLCRLAEQIRLQKEISPKDFSDVLNEFKQLCDQNGVLVKILKKHIDITLKLKSEFLLDEKKSADETAEELPRKNGSLAP